MLRPFWFSCGYDACFSVLVGLGWLEGTIYHGYGGHVDVTLFTLLLCWDRVM